MLNFQWEWKSTGLILFCIIWCFDFVINSICLNFFTTFNLQVQLIVEEPEERFKSETAMDDLINVSIFRDIFKIHHKIVVFQRKILDILSGKWTEVSSLLMVNAQWEKEWWKKELAWKGEKGTLSFSLVFLYLAG